MTDDRTWMSLPEVMDELGMTREAVYQLIADGTFRGWKSSPRPNGHWRIDRRSVDRFRESPPREHRDDYLPRPVG